MATVYVKETGEALDGAIEFLGNCMQIGLDTETTGLDPYSSQTLLISAGNKYKQFVFDVARIGREGVQRLKPILEDPKIVKVLHNAKFDYKFFKVDLGITLDNIFDTMIAEKLLINGRRKNGFGLDDVADKYMNIKMNKEVRATFTKMELGDEFSADQIHYSGVDVEFILEIMQKQRTLFAKHGLEKVGALEMEVIAAIGDLEINGIHIDKKKWLEAETITKAEREISLVELNKIFLAVVSPDMFGIPTINYNSPPQVFVALKKLMGDMGKKLKSTNEQELKEFDHPAVTALLYYRGLAKRISTYGASFLDNINEETGRVHTDFRQVDTVTGRMASADPNLQNIPVKEVSYYRDAFTAPSYDRRIIGADYQAMEMRLLADLSKEPAWLTIFEKDQDAHCEIGTMVLGKPIRQKGTLGPDDPGENIELRRQVKTLNFGVGYGMGPTKLAREAKMPFGEAKAIIQKYWQTFPLIKQFFDEVVNEAGTTLRQRSPYDGRVRWIEGLDPDSGKDQATLRNTSMNYPMQSGNASITKKALIGIRKAIVNKDMMMISTIHDEILVEAHKDCAEEALAIVTSNMVEAAESYVKNVKVKVDGHVAEYWKK